MAELMGTPTDFEQQQLDLMQRKGRYAQQSAVNMPGPGQMVGNRYVATNPLNYLAEMLRGYGAQRGEQQATQELKDLQGKKSTAMADALRTYTDKATGAPAVSSTTTPTQMPSFDEADAASMQGVQGYGATTGAQAARAPDPRGANASLMNAPDAALRQMGMKGMMEMAQQDAAKAQQQQYFGILQKAQTPQQAIAAGVPYETAKQYYESQNLGKTEIGRTAEVEGTNGEKLIQQFDKFGAPVGTPIPAYMAPQLVDQGNRKTFVKPTAGQSFNVNMSPGESARLAQSDRQFNITQNQPVFNADAGGFVYKPTAQAPQGGVVKVDGLGNKPLNETQGNATAFGLRMAEADKLLNTLETGGTTSGGRIKGAVEGTLTSIIPYQGEALAQGAGSIMNTLPNWLGGPNENQQNYAQAKENFITANLRKESGAAIGQGEFVREERKYFPQAGDSPAVLAQKQKARQTAIEAMKIQAGPGSKNIEAKNPSTSPRLRFDAQGNQIQ